MIRRVIYFLCFTVIFNVASAQNQSSSDLKRKQAEIQREIDNLKKQLDQTSKFKRKNLGELNLIQKKIRLREQQINNINDQINVIQGSINSSWRDIVKLRTELDTLKMQYEKSVIYAYKNRSNYDFLNFIFSASSFNDALKRVSYLKSYRAYREQQAANIRNTELVLQEKISGLNLSKKEKSQVLQEQNKQFAVLQVERKEKDAVVSKLKKEENSLKQEMAQKRKQDANLRAAISAAIRREIEAERRRIAALEKERKEKEDAAKKAANATKKSETNESKATSRPVAKTEPKEPRPLSVFDSREEVKLVSDNFEKNRGTLPWPVNSGRIVMKFGRHAYEGLDIDYDNPGITIEAEAGSTIKAVFDGEVAAVTSVGPVQCVIIRHGKYFTSYSNLSSVTVSKGQTIRTGQGLGRLDEKEAGRGELEFLITNEKSVNLNPESWLR